jgi:hypothetical protein
MLNPLKDVIWNPRGSERRSFARSLIIGFPIVAVMLFGMAHLTGRGPDDAHALALGLGGAAAGLLFWAVPAIVRPFYVMWYAVAGVIGFVVGNTLLIVIYYVCVTGIGLLMRLTGRRPLRLNPDPSVKTYWLDAPPSAEPRRYYNQF